MATLSFLDDVKKLLGKMSTNYMKLRNCKIVEIVRKVDHSQSDCQLKKKIPSVIVGLFSLMEETPTKNNSGGEELKVRKNEKCFTSSLVSILDKVYIIRMDI